MEGVNDLLANGERPDADNPADRAAVDVVFEDIAEAIAERPPEERAFIETRFVRRTGMLPAALRDTLIGGQSSRLSVTLLSRCHAARRDDHHAQLAASHLRRVNKVLAGESHSPGNEVLEVDVGLEADAHFPLRLAAAVERLVV